MFMLFFLFFFGSYNIRKVIIFFYFWKMSTIIAFFQYLIWIFVRICKMNDLWTARNFNENWTSTIRILSRIYCFRFVVFFFSSNLLTEQKYTAEWNLYWEGARKREYRDGGQWHIWKRKKNIRSESKICVVSIVLLLFIGLWLEWNKRYRATSSENLPKFWKKLLHELNSWFRGVPCVKALRFWGMNEILGWTEQFRCPSRNRIRIMTLFDKIWKK